MRRVSVVARRVRRLRLGEVRCRLRLLSRDELGCDGGIHVLVQFEADAAASRSDEYLDGDLAFGLRAVIQIDDGIHTLDNLTLQHRLPREPRIEIHNIGLQPLVMESSLDPTDELSRDLLKQEDLHVGNICPKPARQVKPVTVGRGSAVRAGAPTPVRVVATTVAVKARRRTRSAALMAVESTVSRIVTVSATAGFIPARRGRTPRPVVVSFPTTITGLEPLVPLSAPRASAVWRPISVVLFLLRARDLEIYKLVRWRRKATSRKLLTNLTATKLDALGALHGGVALSNGVVLDKTIGTLEGNLRQPAEPVEYIEYLAFRDSFAGQVAYTITMSR
jgi:hypothetical protein